MARIGRAADALGERSVLVHERLAIVGVGGLHPIPTYMHFA